MKPIRLHKLLRVIGVHPESYANPRIDYVSDDIKKINHRTVVFHLNKTDPLNVERFKQLRGCYIVTDQPVLKNQNLSNEHFIFVRNLKTAYFDFIRFYRGQFDIPVVAVTGTCGKTTTKEMIKQMLAKEKRVVGTIRSKNNLRFNHGYLMKIDNMTEVGVFETAMTHPGNLIEEAEYFRPSIGIITTIGVDHLNQMKTMDNYIRAKGEMLAALNFKGTLILNNDDENVAQIDLGSYKGNVLTFGIRQQADYRGSDLRYGDEGMRFTLIHSGNNYPVYVPGLGEHQVMNALAALAAAHQLGMKLEKAIAYLSLFEPVRSHVAILKGINNATIIDDTWSSNPTSMKAALEVLKEKGHDKTRIAVLGKIAYLGEHESKYYEEVAKMLVDYQVDYVITADRHAKRIGEQSVKYGLNPERFIPCQNTTDLIQTLKKLMNEKTIVLFKISMLDPSFANVIKELKQ